MYSNKLCASPFELLQKMHRFNRLLTSAPLLHSPLHLFVMFSHFVLRADFLSFVQNT